VTDDKKVKSKKVKVKGESQAVEQNNEILLPFYFYQVLAQDSLYNPLWDLEGDVGRSTASAFSSRCPSS